MARKSKISKFRARRAPAQKASGSIKGEFLCLFHVFVVAFLKYFLRRLLVLLPGLHLGSKRLTNDGYARMSASR